MLTTWWNHRRTKRLRQDAYIQTIESQAAGFRTIVAISLIEQNARRRMQQQYAQRSRTWSP
jgi:hypothetical protein